MTTAEKLLKVSEGIDKVEELNNTLETALNSGDTGVKSYYDVLWDAIQDYGNRKIYSTVFSRWNCEYIKPKYKAIPTEGTCDSTFLENISLKSVEKQYFDFSKLPTSASSSYMCNGCIALEIFEDIGIPAIASYSRTWRGCKKMHTLEVVRSRAETTYGLAFEDCRALVNITFEGVIGQNGINLQYSPLLSKASITSIINALSNTTTGLSITLSKAAVNEAFRVSPGVADGASSTEWLNLVATKPNWTISLV